MLVTDPSKILNIRPFLILKQLMPHLTYGSIAYTLYFSFVTILLHVPLIFLFHLNPQLISPHYFSSSSMSLNSTSLKTLTFLPIFVKNMVAGLVFLIILEMTWRSCPHQWHQNVALPIHHLQSVWSVKWQPTLRSFKRRFDYQDRPVLRSRKDKSGIIWGEVKW
jgi:hypothetical protein